MSRELSGRPDRSPGASGTGPDPSGRRAADAGGPCLQAAAHAGRHHRRGPRLRLLAAGPCLRGAELSGLGPRHLPSASGPVWPDPAAGTEARRAAGRPGCGEAGPSTPGPGRGRPSPARRFPCRFLAAGGSSPRQPDDPGLDRPGRAPGPAIQPGVSGRRNQAQPARYRDRQAAMDS